MVDLLERFHCASMILCEDDFEFEVAESINSIQDMINENGPDFSEVFNKKLNYFVDKMLRDSHVLDRKENTSKLSLYAVKALGLLPHKVIINDDIRIGWALGELFLVELDHGQHGMWLLGKGNPVSTDGFPEPKTLFELNQYYKNIYSEEIIKYAPRPYEDD